MDSYFLNEQGKFQPALYKVYQEIKTRMSYNLQNYIELNVGYTNDINPIMMDILNTSEILTIILAKSLKINKVTFEESIPNCQVGISYINSERPGAAFYLFKDKTETTFLMMIGDKLEMFFEIGK
jgi:hypothetical protein